MSQVSRPGIAPGAIEERTYQISMADACLRGSTLLILPTGLGKTVVAALVAAAVVEKREKVLFLAPTKPLAEQHFSTLRSLLTERRIAAMNGCMPPAKRAETMSQNMVVVSTPQAVSNDLDRGLYDLDGVGLVVYDEAHRAVGGYAYVNVARHADCLSLGMTASPGSDPAKMREVCANLSLTRVDARTEDDPDVSPYIHDIFVNRIEVGMPEDLSEVIRLLRRLCGAYAQELVDMRLMDPGWPASTKHLLVVGDTLRVRLARGERSKAVFRGLVAQSACVKLLHAVGLAESQGMSALRAYMAKLDAEAGDEKGARGTKEIAASKEFREAWRIVSSTRTEHPKVSRVMSLVSRTVGSRPGSKVIVFSQYRDTCDLLAEKLSTVEGARVGKLIGQSKGGLKQREQIELLERFRSGEVNVVVSTSVGEEGLDVASTDMVVFYEPVPSEIRTIQRRGRTGRKSDGEVYVLIARGTMDEVFESSSRKKEEAMRERLRKLDADLGRRARPQGGQLRLGDFGPNNG